MNRTVQNSEKRNLIIGQIGPTTATTDFVLTCLHRSAKERGYRKIYGMMQGIEGFKNGLYIDLSDYIETGFDEKLFQKTVADFLESGYFRLPEIHEDRKTFDKIFAMFDDLEIDGFICLGGGDSIDAVRKLSDYGMLTGSNVRFVSCPQSIRNDLALTDHTLGFGSAAKYIVTSVKEIVHDRITTMTEHGTVTIVVIAHDNVGWLTGAACLAEDEECEGPDAVYLPDAAFDIDNFVHKCEELLKEKNSIVVCVSKAVRISAGRPAMTSGYSGECCIGHFHEPFLDKGHFLGKVLASHIGCRTRAVELLPYHSRAFQFITGSDLLEIPQVVSAVLTAVDEGETAKMAALVRTSDNPYQVYAEVKNIQKVADEVHCIPRSWVNDEGTYVTDEFITYVRPLICD